MERLRKFDHTTTAWFYQRPKHLSRIFGWITLLGHPIVVTFVAVLAGMAGFGLGINSIGWAFLIALIALAVGSSLKFVLKRPRPQTPYAASMLQHTFSFPSGHAYGAALIYGLVAYLAQAELMLPWGSVMFIGLIPVILLIGFSRVYLGAHYVLDVLGGWLLSIPVLWLIINYILAL